jgi:uncharacterized protein (DUF1501 family)
LNTLVPVDDDLYYRLRPQMAVDRTTTLAIDGEPLLRLHPGMEGIRRMFNDGRLAIVENIGYDNATLSHFAGTEIWNTASGTTPAESYATGWLGRFLLTRFPEYPLLSPSYPPAIQISTTTSSILAIKGASAGMALTDPDEFHALVSGSGIVGDENLDDSAAAEEWRYIRLIDMQSVEFADVIRLAAGRARNMVEYPSANPLARSLAVVARLIAGGLPTPVYVVSLGGFDTHAGQQVLHPPLLAQLSDAIAAFADDLGKSGNEHRVVGMTISEFGRRPQDNWFGTDHGGAAPHFIFGGAIDGGRIHGGLPDLQDLDSDGNLRHAVDFRCYYASMLAPCFDLDEERLNRILPAGSCGPSMLLPLYRNAARVDDLRVPGNRSGSIEIIPNPASDRVEIRCGRMRSPTPLLTLIASDGSRMSITLHQQATSANGAFQLDVSSFPSGIYQVSVDDVGEQRTGRLIIQR